jgi:hypothetical protein
MQNSFLKIFLKTFKTFIVPYTALHTVPEAANAVRVEGS